MKPIKENKQEEVHGYIKGNFIVLHHMDYDHNDENGDAVKVPKLCAFKPEYIVNIRDEYYYGGTVIECLNKEGYTHICESVEEILNLLEEFKFKKELKN